jgi:hypothetical protein
MAVEAERRDVDALAPGERAAMLALMRRYYEDVRPDDFARDLAAKQQAILLRDGAALVGFSTCAWLREEIGGRPVRALFSGDTVVERTHWRSWALPVAWCRMMRDRLAREPDVPLYWFLITKGYRTYRYLPVFFRAFTPAPGRATPPFERALRDALGRRLFGPRYDAAAGIVRAPPGAQRLRPGVAPITEGRRRDPHIAFFEGTNPGHARGDELACLAEWSPGNMQPFILRRL